MEEKYTMGEAFAVAGLAGVFLAGFVTGALALISTPLLLLRAWVITKLCGWYFPTLWHPSMLEAFAAVLLVSVLITPRAPKVGEKISFKTSVIYALVSPLSALALGYAGTFFL